METANLSQLKSTARKAVNPGISAFNLPATKPTSDNFTYTIQASDLPSDSNVTDYQVLVAVGGHNSASTNQNVKGHFSLNGAEIAGEDFDKSVNGLSGWSFAALFASNALVAGDVVSGKVWGSTSLVMDKAALPASPEHSKPYNRDQFTKQFESF
jgi:hypothetical protein